MANIHLGKLREISDLREIWAHEAKDFTPWLEENIDELGKELGIDVVVTERESSVGDFSVDLYAYDGESGKKIIIENQLEDTDHDHLGKLITYASGKDAALVIWIVKHAREEHRAAIEWLNTHTDEAIGFVLCEIKVYQIGDSALAPKFTVIERPNDWVKNMKTSERQGYKKAVLTDLKLALLSLSIENIFLVKKPRYSSMLVLL